MAYPVEELHVGAENITVYKYMLGNYKKKIIMFRVFFLIQCLEIIH